MSPSTSISSLSPTSVLKIVTMRPSTSISSLPRLDHSCVAIRCVNDACLIPTTPIPSLSLAVLPQTAHRPALRYTASRRAPTRLQSLRRVQRAANRFLWTIYLMAIFSRPIRQPSSPSPLIHAAPRRTIFQASRQLGRILTRHLLRLDHIIIRRKPSKYTRRGC